MGGMQPQPGMGGMQPQPQQQNPGMGGMPGSSQGPGVMPGAAPMGGMPGTPQPGMPMGPGPTQPGPNPTGSIRIVFSPSTVQVSPNQFAGTDVVLEGGPDGAGGTVSLQFDPRSLRFTAVAPAAGVEVVENPLSGQPSGRIVLKLHPGPGSRRIVGLTFQAVGSGRSTITVSTVRLINAQGAEIPVQSPGSLTIEVLPPRASWQPGATELPGWGLQI